MVMEFLRGEDLRHAIKNHHTGDLKSKLRIALQVARALEYIHSQKIVHRDIKPENIHINTAGVVKLMDFGIAKTEGLAMTRAGYVLGTPYYMAPEQVTGQGITEQVDVYAFGVLLFEVLTGVKPISGEMLQQRRTVAAGKRRFHGQAFERRWIPDDAERQRHDDVVAERLGQSPSAGPVYRVAEAADRLGVSVSTVRRRVQRGELQAVMQDGRITGVILEAD